jgi:D-glycero-D-manno-heptose 1,7-bisphosphate phosphatase
VSRYRTVFLDRDGTVNVKASEGEYITAPGRLVLLPGAADAVRRLNDAGLRVVLVSNQRGVGRRLMTPAELDAVQDRLQAMLAGAGARLDAAYHCPHLGGCRCRKPLPGLLLRAAAEMPGLRLDSAVTVGDAESDVAAGRAAGTATVRLGPPGTPTTADKLSADLPEAVDWILADGLPSREG